MRRGVGRALLVLLLLLSAGLAFALFHLRRRAEHQLSQPENTTALTPPQTGAPALVTLMLANDMDGSLASRTEMLPLPTESTARARALLNRLIRAYDETGSPHPIGPSAGVDDVFLMQLPKPPNGTAAPEGTLAVVNLSGSFAEAHPSGIEPETLTLLSIIGTLHANLPEVAEVRFLVAGEPRATLAGHADLSSIYLAASTAAPVPETRP